MLEIQNSMYSFGFLPSIKIKYKLIFTHNEAVKVISNHLNCNQNERITSNSIQSSKSPAKQFNAKRWRPFIFALFAKSMQF